MTGIKALQALRDGKKVVHRDFKEEYYIQVVHFVISTTLKKIAWVRMDGKELTFNPQDWDSHDQVDASLFLGDDLEIYNA